VEKGRSIVLSCFLFYPLRLGGFARDSLGKLMNRWTIRECRPDEAEAVLALWRQAGASPSVTDSVEDIHRIFTNSSSRFLVAENQGALIGSLIGCFDGWRANHYRLAVHPDYRRRGVGRALVAEMEKWFVSQGAKKIAALVERDHPWAVDFWQAVGYAEDVRMARYVKK
jgi:ribosomal protein S18 acetylase RimI-like enzyme